MSIQIDQWVWGNETIIWGYSLEHKYTLKLIEPKKGRAGCLSLQFHNEKSETWYCKQGIGWGLFIINNQIVTKILNPGDTINIPTGIIHRLMSLSDNLQILESSTPDQHAADKSIKKDVIRLDCVHGRECDSIQSLVSIVKVARDKTEQAIIDFEKGKLPIEINLDLLADFYIKL